MSPLSKRSYLGAPADSLVLPSILSYLRLMFYNAYSGLPEKASPPAFCNKSLEESLNLKFCCSYSF